MKHSNSYPEGKQPIYFVTVTLNSRSRGVSLSIILVNNDTGLWWGIVSKALRHCAHDCGSDADDLQLSARC